MKSLTPEVHLVICMDSRVSPGATLHALDLLRAQDWKKEIVLLCDKSWEPYITVEQPVIFLNKKDFFHQSAMSKDEIVNAQGLEDFLNQLDSFDIKNILQLGNLSWGRWLKAYLADIAPGQQQEIKFESSKVSPIEVVNIIAEELSLDVQVAERKDIRYSLIYIDPYVDGEVSPLFTKMLKNKQELLPAWANIICNESDRDFFTSLGLKENLIDPFETNINLFNQHLLCFDESSLLAQTSRSYNVALFTQDGRSSRCAYVPGDIVIQPDEDMHLSELNNILSYWKRGRLKELAFQWINMGIEIDVIECFHHRIVKRKIQSYSSDLQHCQYILDKFKQQSSGVNDNDIVDFVRYMRAKNDNDPYALSFSLKILLMITERMLASASIGERIFQRLGSDYHRIVIGEALIEGIFEQSAVVFEEIDLSKQLTQFQEFLYKIDFYNDNNDVDYVGKES